MLFFVALTVGACAAGVALQRVYARLLLSKAKHSSLLGHARLAKRLACLLPAYAYDEDHFFTSDGAPPDMADRRRAGFERLSQRLNAKSTQTLEATARLEPHVSDMQFTAQYRVPFPYRRHVARHLRV